MKPSIWKTLSQFLFAVCCLSLPALVGWNRAEACSPPGPGISQRIVQPEDKSKDIPPNAWIFVEYLYSNPAKVGLFTKENIALRTTNGQSVPITTNVKDIYNGGGRILYWLKPDQELQPNTQYEITSQIAKVPCYNLGPNPCPKIETTVISTFETGTQNETTAPTFQGAQELVCGAAVSCGNSACCGPYSHTAFHLHWNPATNAKDVRYNIYQASNLTTPLLHYIARENVVGYIRHSGHEQFPPWYELMGTPQSGYIVRAVNRAGQEDQNTTIVSLTGACPASSPDAGSPDVPTAPPPDANDMLDAPATPDNTPKTPDKTTTPAPDKNAPTAPDKGTPPSMGCQQVALGHESILCLLVALGICLLGQTRRRA